MRVNALLSTVLLMVSLIGLTGAATHAEDPVTEERTGIVNINDAGVPELTTLPGIGEAMAERIVAFRQQHGPFKRVEDLLKVKGIGERSFQKLRPQITVTDPAGGR